MEEASEIEDDVDEERNMIIEGRSKNLDFIDEFNKRKTE